MTDVLQILRSIESTFSRRSWRFADEASDTEPLLVADDADVEFAVTLDESAGSWVAFVRAAGWRLVLRGFSTAHEAVEAAISELHVASELLTRAVVHAGWLVPSDFQTAVLNWSRFRWQAPSGQWLPPSFPPEGASESGWMYRVELRSLANPEVKLAVTWRWGIDEEMPRWEGLVFCDLGRAGNGPQFWDCSEHASHWSALFPSMRESCMLAANTFSAYQGPPRYVPV